MKKQCYWVYILQTMNGHYYTGYTSDLSRRYQQHLSGKANCRYTRCFPPVGLKQCWQIREDQGLAMKVEYLIKKKSRRIKDELIRDPGKLIELVNKSLKLDLKIRVYHPRKIKKI